MALRGTPRPSAFPASQNTAPVIEHRCLFTSDLRRKQKRWQDGYLKFHTFNSRVMVYDVSRNFLGDTYWKESPQVEEGDELTLDKGIMVQVAEAMGVTQTDLTPLLERKKDSPQRKNDAAPAQRVAPKPPVLASSAPRAASQLRHKSLNALLGTAKGPIGKAAPIISPFEARKEKENQGAEERARKRQKTTHSPTALVSSSPTAPSNEPEPFQRPPCPARSVAASTFRVPPMPPPRPPVLINLVSEPDSISSDVTLPSTPPDMAQAAPRPKATSVLARKERATARGALLATPKIPKGPVPVPHVKGRHTPKPPPEPSSPPISASNRLANVDLALQLDSDRSIDAPAHVQPAQNRSAHPHTSTVQTISEPLNDYTKPPSLPRPLARKSLRLSSGVRRGRLLCLAKCSQQGEVSKEPQLSKKKRQKQKSIQKETIHVVSDGDAATDLIPPRPELGHGRQNEKKKERTPQPVRMVSEPQYQCSSPPSSTGALDDMELVHGLMDQQLVITPSPPPSLCPSIPDSPIQIVPLDVQSLKKAPKERKRERKGSPAKTTSKRPGTKSDMREDEIEEARKRQKQSIKSQPPPQALPATGNLEGSEALRQNPSSTASVYIIEHQSTTSTSVSPPNRPTVSTSGFRKKAKNERQQSVTKDAGVTAPPPVGVAVPPHPPRGSKLGPSVSTTELPVPVPKPKDTVGLTDDPIDDSSQPKFSNKSFQRSRSENDAPIPSISEDWEARNLPKADRTTADIAPVTKAGKSLNSKASGLAALVKRTDPRRKFKRTQSLHVDAGVDRAAEAEIVVPPLDHDVGPWSTEAFDLFDWRPPGVDGSA